MTTLASFTCKVQGLNWPETLGDWTLMGPANRLGSWRWYQWHGEIDDAQLTERIKVDSQLTAIRESLVTIHACPTAADRSCRFASGQAHHTGDRPWRFDDKVMNFTTSELDLLYECVRLQANDLRRRKIHHDSPDLEPGSWAHSIFQLDTRLTQATCLRRNSLG